MKHLCSSSLDRISELPSSIIQTILMFLPLRDMVRTSILSRSWRSQWVTVPQLVFDDVRDLLWNDDNLANYINIVFGILLVHEGPILKFKLDISNWDSCPVMHKIIPLLSRNGIQDLTFETRCVAVQGEDDSDDEHECEKLPSSIFKCIELKHLRLESCVFKPLTLIGFPKLISVELINVYLDPNVTIPCGPLLQSLTLAIMSSIDCFTVDASNLKILHLEGRISSIGFMNTPLVKFLSLPGYHVPSRIDLINLLRYLPLLENLNLYRFQKLLAVGSSPNEFPTVLNNLRLLELHSFELRKMDQLSSTLLWIRSQPNLQILKFTDLWRPTFYAEAELNYQRLQYCDYSLMKLREVEFVFKYDMRPCIEFIKFLLAISPELETLYIKSRRYISDVDWYKNLLEITCSRRASPKAEIVCLDLDREAA